MPEALVTSTDKGGRKVRTETLSVAPDIVGLTLAEPWKRAAAMLIDLCVIGLLSLLAKPFLGIAIGLLLALILGHGKPAPLALRLARWICRGIGADDRPLGRSGARTLIIYANGCSQSRCA